jgi:hypothetical protein
LGKASATSQLVVGANGVGGIHRLRALKTGRSTVGEKCPLSSNFGSQSLRCAASARTWEEEQILPTPTAVKRLALVAIPLCLGAALVLLRDQERPRAAERTASKAVAVNTRTLATPHARLEVHATIERSAEEVARKLSARAAAIDDRAELEAELLAASRSELLQGRARLEKLLRDRPELAPAAARAFEKLGDRETLFVISRALVEHAADADVRATLLDAARNSEPAHREIALMALASARDAEALPLAESALGDTSAAPGVRAAGAWALARDAGHAPASAFAAARALAASPAEDPHLRAEALHLVAETPDASDCTLAEAMLAEPGAPAEVVLAAARLALAAGTDKAAVARALGAHDDRLCAYAARTIEGNP